MEKNSKITPVLDKLNDVLTRVKQTKTRGSFEICGDYAAVTVKKLFPFLAAEAEMGVYQVLHKMQLEALKPPATAPPMYTNLEPLTSSIRLSRYN